MLYQLSKNVKICTVMFQDEIYGSAYAAAAYLRSKKFQKKVYVIGERWGDFQSDVSMLPTLCCPHITQY